MSKSATGDIKPVIVGDVAIIIFADRGESERASEGSAQFDVFRLFAREQSDQTLLTSR